MKNIDRIYQLTNLLSFLIMTVLLLDSMRAFSFLPWFNVNWVFGTLAVFMCLLVFRAKQLDLKRNNPNMIVPVSKYTYIASFVAFFVGYLILEEYSIGQIVTYGIALVLDLFSSISSMVVVSKMKRKTI